MKRALTIIAKIIGGKTMHERGIQNGFKEKRDNQRNTGHEIR